MVTRRLDAPFAASRQYPENPRALAFDLLTLPFQVSNVLFGVPPIEIPVFGQALGTPPAPAPGPGADGGIDTGGVVLTNPFGQYSDLNLATVRALNIVPYSVGSNSLAPSDMIFSATVLFNSRSHDLLTVIIAQVADPSTADLRIGMQAVVSQVYGNIRPPLIGYFLLENGFYRFVTIDAQSLGVLYEYPVTSTPAPTPGRISIEGTFGI